MTEKQIQFLELDNYINDNIDKLTKEEYEKLVEELNVLVYEILNNKTEEVAPRVHKISIQY